VFMYGTNRPEVHGLDRFRALLDEREDPRSRKRGLITVSNHISVIDDPFIWGSLPFRYGFNPDNMRWTLGSYDICFKNKITSTIFNLGQVLPTHRLKHSVHGGLFQPTMSEAIRLLSDCPSAAEKSAIVRRDEQKASKSLSSPDLADPFSNPSMTYSTNGEDVFPAPSGYTSRRYAWIHVFPEGLVNQHPQRIMRYFKWGVGRLILEADECPDIVPIWIEGNEKIMAEDRGFPRPVPRLGQKLGIWFGENVAGQRESVFQDLRQKWKRLVQKEEESGRGSGHPDELSEELKYGKEAVQLRIEAAKRVREAVLEVRRRRGLPNEDPGASLAETWKVEGGASGNGRNPDGSIVKGM